MPWRQVPQIVRNKLKRFLVYFLAGLFVVILLMMLSSSPFFMYAAFAYPPSSIFIFFFYWNKRLTQQLKASDFKLCPKCGYQLTGLAGKICCPECGLDLDVEEVESQWRRYCEARSMSFR